MKPNSAILFENDSRNHCREGIREVEQEAKGKACYVCVFDAPLSAWRAYHRSRYLFAR
jgi:hypothetical protein